VLYYQSRPDWCKSLLPVRPSCSIQQSSCYTVLHRRYKTQHRAWAKSSLGECTDSQLNAEHWFARIKKLYHRNSCLIIITNYLTYRCRLCIKIPPTHLTNKTEINRNITFEHAKPKTAGKIALSLKTLETRSCVAAKHAGSFVCINHRQ